MQVLKVKMTVMLWRDSEKTKIISLANQNYSTRQFVIVFRSVRITSWYTIKMLPPYYLTAMNNDFELPYRWTQLVHLATGLRPECRFSPIARALTTVLEFEKNLRGKLSLSWKFERSVRTFLNDISGFIKIIITKTYFEVQMNSFDFNLDWKA